MDYLIYLMAGSLGVLVHCLFKVKDLIDYAQKANIEFSINDYLKKDWFAISVSFATVFIWLLIFGEVGNAYPKIIDFIRCTFILMGWFGSYIAQKVFSRGKSYISNIIDKKTNIADAFVADALADIGGSNPPPEKDEK